VTNVKRNTGGTETVYTPVTGQVWGLEFGKIVADLNQEMYIIGTNLERALQKPCKLPTNGNMRRAFQRHGQKRMGQFWNVVRKSKDKCRSSSEDVSFTDFSSYFQTKTFWSR